MAKSKIEQIATLLDGTSHFAENPLASYHAAKLVRNATLRVGVDRQLAAAKKAVKAFNVIVSPVTDTEGRRGLRLYSPIKQQELRFFA
jgi:hypothetical protein